MESREQCHGEATWASNSVYRCVQVHVSTRGRGGTVVIFILALLRADPIETLIPQSCSTVAQGQAQAPRGEFFPTGDVSEEDPDGEIL